MYVTMDVNFSEDELFFLPSHTAQGETTKSKNYGWFDLPLEAIRPNNYREDCLYGCAASEEFLDGLCGEGSPDGLIDEQTGHTAKSMTKCVDRTESLDGQIDATSLNSPIRPSMPSSNNPSGQAMASPLN